VLNKLDTMLQVGRTFGVRDGFLRLQYELERGSGLISWRMRSVHGWNSWELDRIAPGIQSEDLLTTRREGKQKFFFIDARSLQSSLQQVITPEAKQAVLAQANNILNGKLPFFGSLSFDCGFPPRWFQNPATGQSVSPAQPWTEMRFASPIYGDLKFILEPSRFQFVYPLARAYALTGDDRFPEAFWKMMEDWAHRNPPMAGPLWICGQESSLRIVALSFAFHAFVNSPSTTADRAAMLVSMIAAHAWRTAQTLGYARSQRSNHLITEAVGLWTAGTLYPELIDAQVWKNLGAPLLCEAVLDQITPEGVSQQHSFNYQRMILQLLLWTLRLSEIHNSLLNEEIHARAQAAWNFMRGQIDPVSGHAPNYGSDDGSLIFPLAHVPYQDFRPLIQLGAAVLNRPALLSGPWDEAALWFGMHPKPAENTERILHDSNSNATGYFRIGDENSWTMIRAGHYTRRPFQADQLHVDLWWNGINLARDPGTYLYNGPAPWNNGFASTAIHNTITIDGQDQMRRASRFLWLDWAQASGRAYSSTDADNIVDTFEGEHDGYNRLGVTHRRMVRWLKDCGWIIIDDVVGTAEHEARLHWLIPDSPFNVTDSPFQVISNSMHGRIRWNIFSSASGKASVIRAGKQVMHPAGRSSADDSRLEKNLLERNLLETNKAQLLGWYAPTYGDLQPAVSLVYQTHSHLPVRFVTAVLTHEECALELRDDEVLISKANSSGGSSARSEIYCVNLRETMQNAKAGF
jgi:Heparinase II/III-like protein/Heparinase II/III N-terminus